MHIVAIVYGIAARFSLFVKVVMVGKQLEAEHCSGVGRLFNLLHDAAGIVIRVNVYVGSLFEAHLRAFENVITERKSAKCGNSNNGNCYKCYFQFHRGPIFATKIIQ